MPSLLSLFLWNCQQRIHILLDGIVFLGFGSRGFVPHKERFLFSVEIGKLRFYAFRCRQRHSPQPIQFSGGRFKNILLADNIISISEQFQEMKKINFGKRMVIWEQCSDPIKLDLIIQVVIYCPDIFMPRNACAYTVQD